MENWVTDKDLARANVKKREWKETYYHEDGTSSKIHYIGDPITREEFVKRTRSARLDMPKKDEPINNRFEILDL